MPNAEEVGIGDGALSAHVLAFVIVEVEEVVEGDLADAGVEAEVEIDRWRGRPGSGTALTAGADTRSPARIARVRGRWPQWRRFRTLRRDGASRCAMAIECSSIAEVPRAQRLRCRSFRPCAGAADDSAINNEV